MQTSINMKDEILSENKDGDNYYINPDASNLLALLTDAANPSSSSSSSSFSSDSSTLSTSPIAQSLSQDKSDSKSMLSSDSTLFSFDDRPKKNLPKPLPADGKKSS